MRGGLELSAYPRTVLTDTWVSWNPNASGQPSALFVRHGTVVDIKPGSALEAAYGGSGNLSAVLGPDAAQLQHAGISN